MPSLKLPSHFNRAFLPSPKHKGCKALTFQSRKDLNDESPFSLLWACTFWPFPLFTRNKSKSGNYSSKALLVVLHDLTIMTALLRSDPLWPINKWDTLTSKRIFHLSLGLMTPITSLQVIRLLERGRDYWMSSLPKSKNCQRWNVCFGPNKWYQEREGNE